MSNRYNSGRPGKRAFGGSNRGGGGFKRNGRSVKFKKGPKKQYINPERFIKKAKPLKHTVYEPQNSFDDFELHNKLKDNLRSAQITTPTKIQDQSIPHSVTGRDVLGLANTGTGKTIAFLAPLISRIIHGDCKKALIIAPTRELAQQIQAESRRISRGLRIFDVLLIGGMSIGPQLRDLSRQHQIVIGTPGRIKDHLERGTLDLTDLDVVVLDEVDRMLDMGFVNDIRSILSSAPSEKQSLFFSATMDNKIEGLINQFGNEPIKIVATTADTSDNVEQSVTYYNDKAHKIDLLHDLLVEEGVDKVLIFCETKRYTDRLSRELADRGFKAGSIHGDKSQGQRKRALEQLKQNRLNILVATDVAARGIDVDGISHVVNYDTPQSYEDYTHRIGRTGRGNNQGYSVTFVEQPRSNNNRSY